MSIAAINPSANWWQWREQATAPSTSSGTTSTASSTSDATGNSGSVSAGGSMSSFMQALSADLQAMLAQSGSDPASAATATATATGQNAANQPDGSVPHHHHHHHGGGAQGSMQSAANQLVGAVGQMSQGGTLSSSQINQQASMFATDIVQALQAYGTTATSGSGGSIVA